jgi:hypothetical protein
MVEDYAHLDYIWCEDANQDIYQDIIKILKKHVKRNTV